MSVLALSLLFGAVAAEPTLLPFDDCPRAGIIPGVCAPPPRLPVMPRPFAPHARGTQDSEEEAVVEVIPERVVERSPFGISVGAHHTVTVDFAYGHFYAQVGGNPLFAGLVGYFSHGVFLPIAANLGAQWRIWRHWWLSLTGGMTGLFETVGSNVALGAQLGLRYEGDTGFVFQLALPVFGYTFTYAGDPGGAIGIYYLLMLAAHPVIGFGYRF